MKKLRATPNQLAIACQFDINADQAHTISDKKYKEYLKFLHSSKGLIERALWQHNIAILDHIARGIR